MLHEQEILKLIAGGENSYVEFKEDTVDNKSLRRRLSPYPTIKAVISFWALMI